MFREDSPMLSLPEVNHGAQILEWLHEVGPVQQGMNGPEPLSWIEINAWKQATGTEITTQELVMLRQLSSAYVQQYNVSDNPQAPPPNAPRGDKVQVAKSLRAGLRAARKPPKD